MASEYQQLDLIRFRTPVVRHLAWLCQAPQLMTGPTHFSPSSHLAESVMEILSQWDLDPAKGPGTLSQTPHYRLGLYVESLYNCLLSELLGWQVLARNLPIRSAGTTLGELDFLVRNPITQDVEHHEIAVKFYLGHRSSQEHLRWYGPNAHDRLDLKTRKLMEQQSPRSRLPETRTVLSAMGITEPVTPRVFMPGYLFYPLGEDLTPPASVAPNHLRGHWAYLHETDSIPTAHWVPLRKPHWLGPWRQADAPDANLVHQALADIESTSTPRLFAMLEYKEETGLWQEIDRIFVVPATWPGVRPVPDSRT
jgi:uncharacterized protein